MSEETEQKRQKFIGRSGIKNIGVILAAFGLPVLLSGCVVGPKFKTPETRKPESFTKIFGNTPGISRIAEEPVSLRWWRLLKDPVLNRLEEEAAHQNLSVAVAEDRLAAARDYIGVAIGGFFPDLTLNGSYTREKASNKGMFTAFGNSGAGRFASGAGAGETASGSSQNDGAGGVPTVNMKPFSMYQIGVGASLGIDLWGRQYHTVRYAEALETSAFYNARSVKLQVAGTVARDYIRFRLVQKETEIVQSNLQIAEEVFRLITERQKVGLATSLDADRASAQLLETKASLPLLAEQKAVLINQLAVLVNRSPEKLALALAKPEAVPTVPPVVPVGLPSELLLRRPDVQAALAGLQAATDETGIAVADFFPSFSLTGSFGLQSLSAGDLLTYAARQWAWGPDITLPLFEGGRLVSQLHLYRAKQRAAAALYKETVLKAVAQVNTALNAYQEAQYRYEALDSALKSEKQALFLVTRQYKIGVTDYFNVLDVQRNVLSVDREAASAFAALSLNLVTLYQALGGGWPVKNRALVGASES